MAIEVKTDDGVFLVPEDITAGAELFFDTDLDELRILFHGRDRRYSVLETGRAFDLLLDPSSDEVLGILIPRYTRHVIVDSPNMADALRLATIISDGRVSEFSDRARAVHMSRIRRNAPSLRHRVLTTIRLSKGPNLHQGLHELMRTC